VRESSSHLSPSLVAACGAVNFATYLLSKFFFAAVVFKLVFCGALSAVAARLIRPRHFRLTLNKALSTVTHLRGNRPLKTPAIPVRGSGFLAAESHQNMVVIKYSTGKRALFFSRRDRETVWAGRHDMFVTFIAICFFSTFGLYEDDSLDLPTRDMVWKISTIAFECVDPCHHGRTVNHFLGGIASFHGS